MADILKVSPPQSKTTPTISRNIPHPQTPFQITDTVKVNNLNTAKETSKQNQTILSGGGPSVLQDLLKDPLGSIRYIQSIYLLQEVMSLMPLNSEMLNEDLMRLFSSMLLNPNELTNEMILQEKYSSIFQGELFDYLRQLMKDSGDQVKTEIYHLIKSLVAQLSKEQMKESLIYQMKEVLDEFAGSKFEPEIKGLIEKLTSEEFPLLLQEDLKGLFSKLESSIRFSAKSQSIRSMIQYNLSRFETMRDVHSLLLPFKDMEGVDGDYLTKLVFAFLAQRESESGSSKVMDTLINLLQTQIDHATTLGLSKEKIQSIIYSMLASPSHFIPLLHMVLPLQFNHLTAYGELWLRCEDQKEGERDKEKNIHVLLSVETDKMGHVEFELRGNKQQMNVLLHVQKPYVQLLRKFEDRIAMIFYASSYRLQSIKTLEINQRRTLFEVFDDLPINHMGVNMYV